MDAGDERTRNGVLYDWLLVFADNVPEEESKVRTNMIRAIKAAGLVTLLSKSSEGGNLSCTSTYIN